MPAMGICGVEEVDLSPVQLSHRGGDWRSSSRLHCPGDTGQGGGYEGGLDDHVALVEENKERDSCNSHLNMERTDCAVEG